MTSANTLSAQSHVDSFVENRRQLFAANPARYSMLTLIGEQDFGTPAGNKVITDYWIPDAPKANSSVRIMTAVDQGDTGLGDLTQVPKQVVNHLQTTAWDSLVSAASAKGSLASGLGTADMQRAKMMDQYMVLAAAWLASNEPSRPASSSNLPYAGAPATFFTGKFTPAAVTAANTTNYVVQGYNSTNETSRQITDSITSTNRKKVTLADILNLGQQVYKSTVGSDFSRGDRYDVIVVIPMRTYNDLVASDNFDNFAGLNRVQNNEYTIPIGRTSTMGVKVNMDLVCIQMNAYKLLLMPVEFQGWDGTAGNVLKASNVNDNVMFAFNAPLSMYYHTSPEIVPLYDKVAGDHLGLRAVYTVAGCAPEGGVIVGGHVTQ